MSLAGTLSAVRELILDVDQIPDEINARRLLYSNRFQALSSDEIEDLARIEPEQVAAYTRCIYNGQFSTVAAHFPATLALLQTAWSSSGRGRWSGREFMRALHRSFPWRGNTTLALCENLVRFISSALADIATANPYILAAANFEIEQLKLKRAINEKQIGSRMQPSRLSALTVEQLLALKVRRSAPSILLEAEFDLREFVRALKAGEKCELPPMPKRVLLLGFRAPDFSVRWLELPPYWLELARNAAETPIALYEFAKVTFEQRGTEVDEHRALIDALEVLLPLLREGALLTEA